MIEPDSQREVSAPPAASTPGVHLTEPADGPVAGLRSWFLLGMLVLGYIGIYLCRKNFSVANPLIRQAFGLSKEQIGIVASYSTLAYMIGKFVFGPLIDRVGGRAAFLFSLLAVGIFGAAGGMVHSLAALTLVYSLNRLAGSAGWGGMVKQVPNWFRARSMSLAMGVLSLGFVFGGICATLLAGVIAKASGNNWRWIMGGPSLALALILVLCWAVLPREERRPLAKAAKSAGAGFRLQHIAELLRVRQFWIVCALSFTLTLLRETFNTWTVDFFQTTAAGTMSSQIAAFLSTPFDAVGAVGILLLGWVFGRIGKRARMALVFTILMVLALLVFVLPTLGSRSAWLGMAAVGGIGFLVYGPYSLLAGVLSVEIRGKEYVATVAGMVDGTGYLAGILAGAEFGHILDVGGYRLGFTCLAGLALISAVLSLFLYPWRPEQDRPTE